MRDRDVRLAIRAQLEVEHAGDDDTLIVEEMGVWSGSVRVDVAVINGALSGFELKSARDTLARLPQQAHFYSEVFDRMTIVTAENHLSGCLSLLPDWWAVLIAHDQSDGTVNLTSFRDGQANPSQNALQIARLLWKAEAVAVLDKHGLAKGYRSKPADELHHRLTTVMPLETLKNEVRSCLKGRPNWLSPSHGN